MKKLLIPAIRINFRLKCLIINFILAVFVGCGSSKNVVYNWQEQPLVASGIEKDWGEISRYDMDSKLWYKVSHDSKNLYIMLKMDDEALKRKVLMNGLKVFIDTTNHKKEKFGIHFPVKRSLNPEARSEFKEKPIQMKENQERMKERLLEELQTIELIGFNNRESDMLMIGESKIRPVMTFDQYNAIIYQLVLPLGYVCKNLAANRAVSIGFEVGKSERPANGMPNANGEGMSGARHGGGEGFGGRGGGRSGGMGHGRYEGGQKDFSKASTPAEFWLKDYCISCKSKK